MDQSLIKVTLGLPSAGVSLGEIKQLVSGIDTELWAISEGLGQCK